MPSIGTISWAVRVKNGTKEAFEDIGKQSGRTAAQILNIVGDSFAEGEVWIENGKLVCKNTEMAQPCGVTPLILSEAYDDETESCHELHLVRMVKAMRGKGYPDRVIRDKIDSMIEAIKDGGRYNSRRDSGEWGC